METDNKQNFCKDFYISFHQNASWKMDKFHFHDTYEILLCLSDGGEFFVGESTYPIKRGGLLVFNSMDLHRSAGSTQPSYDRYVAHFPLPRPICSAALSIRWAPIPAMCS